MAAMKDEEEDTMEGRPQFDVNVCLPQIQHTPSLSQLFSPRCEIDDESRDRSPCKDFPSELPQLVASPISSRPPDHASCSDGDGFKPPDDHNKVADSDGFGESERGRGKGSSRWSTQETLALLRIRSEMDAAFRAATLKTPFWKEVSRRMAQLGFHRSEKKCREKVENVTKYYKRTKGGTCGRENRKIYRFFKQMEALYTDCKENSLNNIIGCGGEGSSRALEATAGGGGLHSAAQKPATATDLNAISLLSDSSHDYNDDDTDNNSNSEKRHRKRKRTFEEKMMSFFEKLTERVMQKQEMMHQRFMEIIDKREQERMTREEAWKRQEMTRMSTETELRSRDRALSAARDTALVAFLHKVTGQTLNLPQPKPQPQPQPPQQINNYNDDKEPAVDPLCNRWPKQEVEALIKIRSEFEPRFHEVGSKTQLWDLISAAMATMGYCRSPKRCKEKWENINKYFRKAKNRSDKGSICQYFHQLDELYRNGILKYSCSEKVASRIRDQDQPEQEEPLHRGSDTINNNNYHKNQLINSQPDSAHTEHVMNVGDDEEKQPDLPYSATDSSFLAMAAN